MKRVFPAICFFASLVAQQSFARSATWNLNPTSGDWSTAANWTPQRVPNGLAATATFETSDVTTLAISSRITVASCIFDQAASAFGISAGDAGELTFAGAGVINHSTNPQTFIADLSGGTYFDGNFIFINNATIAGLVHFDVKGRPIGQGLASIVFRDESSAGSATFFNEAGDFNGGIEVFNDNSTAGNARFFCQSNSSEGSGQVSFNQLSSAGHGTFIVDGCGNASPASTPLVFFDDFSTADHATFTLRGSTVSGAFGGAVVFSHHATAADAVIILEGTDVTGGMGGTAEFVGGSSGGGSAGNATIIVKGGQAAGGDCTFGPSTDGGTARIELFGNGTLTSYEPELTVGSIEGNGSIPLSNVSLTVGRNNLSTTFAGVISDGAFGPGTLTKIGTGTLTLSGANTYSGVTTVSDGSLLVNNRTGSGTGAGALNVNAGILGGEGIISGATTIGTGGGGAALSPGKGATDVGNLTVQSTVTFNDSATYIFTIDTNTFTSDSLTAAGVSISPGATISVVVPMPLILPPAGFTAINNTARTPINGTFANLPDGGTIIVDGNTFQANYEGGDGNDLTLTVLQ